MTTKRIVDQSSPIYNSNVGSCLSSSASKCVPNPSVTASDYDAFLCNWLDSTVMYLSMDILEKLIANPDVDIVVKLGLVVGLGVDVVSKVYSSSKVVVGKEKHVLGSFYKA
jgi:uncharacterized protein (DUF779 family)